MAEASKIASPSSKMPHTDRINSLRSAARSQYQLMTAQSLARLPLGLFCAGERAWMRQSLTYWSSASLSA
jgi:hypothetical protein